MATVKEEVEANVEGKLAVNKTVTITVEDNQLSVSSDTSLIETLFMLNEGSKFVLERALVNSDVAEQAETEED